MDMTIACPVLCALYAKYNDVLYMLYNGTGVL